MGLETALRRATAIGAFVLAISVSITAPAQTPAAEGPTLSQSLVDEESAFQFARHAIAAGDIRGAITALERVLQINPGLANIKFELGLLYLRVGQFDLARSYLEATIASPDAPETVRERARQAIRSAEGQLRTVRASGSIFVGVQYQSNPNGSPDAVSVVGVGNIPIILTGDNVNVPRDADISATLAGNLEIAFGLGDQRGTEIVTSFSGAINEYDKTDVLDALYADVRIGPRFALGAARSPSGFVRPYVSYTHLNLGGAGYFDGFGAGVAIAVQSSLRASFRVTPAYQNRSYRDSAGRPRGSDQSGDYWSLTGTGAFQIGPRTRLEASLVGELVEADRNFWSRTSLGTGLALSQAISAPGGGSTWFGTISANYRNGNYRAPDPIVDPVRERKDDRFSVDIGLTIPLSQSISVNLLAQQTWNQSNLPNYDFNNSLVSGGLNFRF